MQNRWGIYMIQSVLFPDRVYIGSSTTVKNRIRDHKIMLKNNLIDEDINVYMNKLIKLIKTCGLKITLFK